MGGLVLYLNYSITNLMPTANSDEGAKKKFFEILKADSQQPKQEKQEARANGNADDYDSNCIAKKGALPLD